MLALKECCKCKAALEQSSFSRDKTRKDGLNPRCKACYAAEKRDYWAANGARVKEQRRQKYWSNPEESRAKKNKQRNADLENKRLREDRKRNPDKYKNYALKACFGITLDDYLEMHGKQGGVCKICRRGNKKNKRLAVDHCHKTGRIRGLLCENCNKAIGMLDDNPEILNSAIKYLKEKYMKEKIKVILASALAAFNGLSTKVKAAILLVASALLVAKFRDLFIDLLVNGSKRLLKNTEQKDAELAAKENAANQAANALVDKANKLAQEKPTVDDDWYKK